MPARLSTKAVTQIKDALTDPATIITYTYI